MWPIMPKLPKITRLLFLCSILRKNWVMKLIVYTQISIKGSYKLIVWFWWGWSSIPKIPKIASLQCLKMKLIFCMEINIKVSKKFISTFSASEFPTRLILSLLMGTIKHSQITQSNKFAISLQYIKKQLSNGGRFWHENKRQRLYLIWWKWPDIIKIPKIGSR